MSEKCTTFATDFEKMLATSFVWKTLLGDFKWSYTCECT